MRDEVKAARIAVEQAARELAGELGLEIVDLAFHGQGNHSQLRLDIDRPGPTGVGIADCERFSRALDARIDGLDVFGSSYELQVSSPGIDRPLKSDDDIRRNVGRPVRMEFRDELGRVREARGTLAGDQGTSVVRLMTDAGEISVARSAVSLLKQDVLMSTRKRKNP